MRRALGVELPLRRLFEAPSVEALARAVEAAPRVAGDSAPLVPVDRTGPLPLSFAQERFWFVDRLGGGAAFNMPAAARLRGALDADALQRALDALVERHEMLRTAFVERGGVPAQLVVHELRVVIDRRDAVSVEEARGIAQRLADTPFDLAQAPLKEYLQQKVTSFREPCTLTKVLTWLKEIIRDNLLFDERNPSMIVGDAALEAALKRKRVHVNDIRSVVVHQLVLVEAREGPWSQALLLRGMARLENMPVPPRPEEPTAATPVSALGTRAIGYIPIPPRAVVLHSPGSGASQNPSRDIPAGLLRIDNPMCIY